MAATTLRGRGVLEHQPKNENASQARTRCLSSVNPVAGRHQEHLIVTGGAALHCRNYNLPELLLGRGQAVGPLQEAPQAGRSRSEIIGGHVYN